MSDKPVVTLSLTQREVNALFMITGKIGGSPTKSMRGVFSGSYFAFRPILSNYVSDDHKIGDNNPKSSRSVEFKKG